MTPLGIAAVVLAGLLAGILAVLLFAFRGFGTIVKRQQDRIAALEAALAAKEKPRQVCCHSHRRPTPVGDVQ